MYAEEAGYMIANNGSSIVTFSMEEFEQGKFKKYGVIEKEDVLYRGWMFTPKEYRQLYKDIKLCGANLLITPEQYELCHYLPNWYSLIKEFTAETIILSFDSNHDYDLDTTMSRLGWKKYFVKDYVKSVGEKSIAESVDDVAKIRDLIFKSRGKIEGGLCIRKFEEYVKKSEKRHFVFNGVVHSPDGATPDVVTECAKRIKSPFFSVDVAKRKDGVMRVIEIGDGQVSDLKSWNAKDFVNIFKV